MLPRRHPHRRFGRRLTAVAGALLVAATAAAQTGPGGAPFGGPMDDHFRRDAARGIGQPSRAFAFAAEVEGAVVIEQVEEQRQARGAPRFTIHVRNRTAEKIAACDILALVVGDQGTVTAKEAVPTLKPLGGRATRRVQAELHGLELRPTDRVGFVIRRVDRGPGDVFIIDDTVLAEMATQAAHALPRRQ